MDSLRLTLMVIALLVFAGVFFWSKRSERPGGASVTQRRADSPEPTLSDLSDDSYDDPEIEQFRMSHDDEPADQPDDYQEAPMIKTETDDEILSGTQAAFQFDDIAFDNEDSESSSANSAEQVTTDSENGSATEKATKEKILLIGLLSDSDDGFSGPDVLSALREVGLEHGEMNIFHHFGVGHALDKTPLFSMANMFEPGDFDPAQLENALCSKGYVLFMRAEGKRDDRVSLELMLNTANRLAGLIGAQVLDRTRQPLREVAIEQMRAQLTYA